MSENADILSAFKYPDLITSPLAHGRRTMPGNIALILPLTLPA